MASREFDLESDDVDSVVGADYHSQLLDDIELLDGASEEFDMENGQHRKAVSCLLRIGSD